MVVLTKVFNIYFPDRINIKAIGKLNSIANIQKSTMKRKKKAIFEGFIKHKYLILIV
jgi:hypothetical protein